VLDGVPRAFRTATACLKVALSGVEGLPQPRGKQFAQQWADYCQARFGLLLPHGTDALRLGLAAVFDHDGLEYGGEVIVPNVSFIASATAALDRRFGIVFVDVDPDTLLVDPARVEEAIVPGKTRAIMAVHLFGQPANMSALRDIANRYGLKIIEDAAQAHGAVFETGPCGALGDAAAFSFQSSKNLSCGEGGLLTTNDPEVFDRAYSLHNAGRSRVNGERWGHATLGWNCRATEYQAALLLQRFGPFLRQQERRQRNFARLRTLLEDVPCLEPLGVHPGVVKHGVHMFVMRYRPDLCGGLVLADFLKTAQAEGVPIGRGYAATLADQPAIQKLRARRPEYFRLRPTPVAEHAVKGMLVISHDAFLGSDADMVELASGLRKIQRHYVPSAVPVTAEPAPKGRGHAAASVSVAPQPSRRLRCGLVGAGVMGRNHAEAVVGHRLVSLVAVTDVDSKRRDVAERHGCRWFDSPESMIGSGTLDVVIIATPHWQHAKLAVAALNAGLHVVCEKPLSVTVAQADEILRAKEASKASFAVVHQSRFEPAYQQAKRLLQSGELGPIIRCSMVETMWRTETYYQSSPWRATWRGEGGGVLLNQAPHVLDRYAWLCGMPERVSGRCDTALHRIEVEDIASAVFRHANGAHGQLHVSTNESPSVAETVIACDRGQIVIDNGALRVTRLGRSIREATRTDPQFWGDLGGATQELGTGALGTIPELLGQFYENFALAADGRADLVCPGEQGRDAVELANAILLSSELGQEVRLPLDRAAYDKFMANKLKTG
jgi:dTDP-4-amino-4,6-dideoxygalactose transaminase/predicted dehydrogenase